MAMNMNFNARSEAGLEGSMEHHNFGFNNIQDHVLRTAHHPARTFKMACNSAAVSISL
jgi:hypothetical protein